MVGVRKIVVYEIDPHDYGIEYADASDITGGDGKENAEIAKSIFNGEKSARRDIIVLNSAAGIYIGGKADSYKEAVEIAKQTIDSGNVMDKVNELVLVASPNLIIKYGRFIPNQKGYDNLLLGVKLASPNQWAERYE